MYSRFVPMLAGALLALSAVPVHAGTETIEPAIETLSVDEIREGMTGYGYTVFEGTTPERFEFRVVGIVPHFYGWPKAIMVELFGGPVDEAGASILEKHHTIGGMSGSPMYIENRLIGGLALASGFATTSKAFVTPIEYQFGMNRPIDIEAAQRVGVAPGASTMVCLVYGDTDNCYVSTATTSARGDLFVMAHSVDNMGFEPVRLPAFEVPVVDTLENQEKPSKMAGVRGRYLGRAYVHGMYGFVIREGIPTPTVPITLTIEDVYPEPKAMRWNMAYHTSATTRMRVILNEELRQLSLSPTVVARISARVILREPKSTIRWEDEDSYSISALERFLDMFIRQELDTVDIERVDLTFRPDPELEKWDVERITHFGKRGKDEALILAQRKRDKRIAQLAQVFDGSVFWENRKNTTFVFMDGDDIPNKLYDLLPIRDVLPYLALIENREALYLVHLESDDHLKIDKKLRPDSWTQRQPRVLISGPIAVEHAKLQMSSTDGIPLSLLK
jgi:hypothetical protein